jgi:hypothetical protein
MRLAALLVVVWAIPATLAIIETLMFARMSGRPQPLATVVLREATTWIVYGAFAPAVFWFATRFPLRPPGLRSHLALHFAGAVAIGAIAAAAGTAGMRHTITSMDTAQLRDMSSARMFLSWFLGGLPVAILSYFAVVGVAHAISYFREAQQRREDSLRLEGQLADARLAALQGRLHPHFLYNTLNAITVLVRDGDIARSTRMLELLGTMLRRVLDGSLPHVVSLSTELALLRQYLEIEEVRFSDRLTVTIEADERALHAGVPALVTQPLAENVIRHAVAHTSRHVSLRISARVIVNAAAGREDLELSVEDDGPGLTSGWEQRRAGHTGLSATDLRLATLYGTAAFLDIRAREGGGVLSRVCVPYSWPAEAPEPYAVAPHSALATHGVVA